MRGVIGGVLGALGRVLGWAGGMAGAAQAVDLPADKGELMFHLYDGGGVQASGPAVLVRKSLFDKFSLAAGYYVDAVSNASIDVVTTASPYSETRQQADLALDYVVRDATLRLSGSQGREPDYTADTWGVDVSQETFGGMTTVSLGYTEGVDQVGQKGTPGWLGKARHWNYRVGLTQILSPRWMASVNAEALSDEGLLGSPYRVARVFGAAVPEQVPRTRHARAVKFRLLGDVSDTCAGNDTANRQRHAAHADYRYYWDNWGVRAHTVEGGYSRYLGERWLLDGWLRFNQQGQALFYRDDAAEETRYITRNRQLADFRSTSLGARATYRWLQAPGKYDLKAHASVEFVRFDYDNFTDIRTGRPYAFTGTLLQLYLSASF